MPEDYCPNTACPVPELWFSGEPDNIIKCLSCSFEWEVVEFEELCAQHGQWIEEPLNV